MKRALLCICPPYPYISPPAGAAALLGYLEAHGIDEFGFLDLRLPTPGCFEPTYTATGAFGESYVMDVPDLPLVLEVLRAADAGIAYTPQTTKLLEQYCFERGVSPAYLAAYLEGMNRYIVHVVDRLDDVDFIGFSVWTSNFLATLVAAHHLKRRPRPPFVVAGGPQVTESPASAELGLRSGLFDAIVTGEGEEALRAVYTAFCVANRAPVHGIAGTKYLDSATGRIVASAQPLLKLAQLPLPSFRDMVIDAYQIDDDRTLPYQMSRGCTDKCTFCSEWVFWQRFRVNGGAETAENVARLQSLYGATYISFTDSLLNGSPKRLVAFAEDLLRRRIKIGWGGFMRAQIDDETARLIHQAGCQEVFVGVESFDDRTLEAMNKRRTESDNVRALEAFLEAGLFVVAGLIPGFPGDSRQGFLHSAAVLRRLQRRYPGRLRVNTEPFRVSPGQPLYQSLEAAGLTPHPWDSQYLDIAPQYREVTSRIHCFVEGTNQGLERIGRERIAFMISTDALVRTDKFDYDEDEDVAVDEFSFRHVHGGWSLARIKSDFSCVYALLVSEAEQARLEELTNHARVAGLRHPELAAFLRSVAAAHISAPSADVPPVPHPRFHDTIHVDNVVGLSPFVVIRQLNWRHNRDVLAVNYVNGRWVRRSQQDGGLLSILAEHPRQIAALIAEANGGSHEPTSRVAAD